MQRSQRSSSSSTTTVTRHTAVPSTDPQVQSSSNKGGDGQPKAATNAVNVGANESTTIVTHVTSPTTKAAPCTHCGFVSEGVTPTVVAPQSPKSPSKKPPSKFDVPKTASRWRDLGVRTASTVVLIALFSAVIYSGQWGAAALVVVLQVAMFHELMTLFYKHYVKTEKNVRLFRSFQWYFLLAVLFFIYGRMLRHLFSTGYPTIDHFLTHYHTFASFLVWTFGFVGFVISLERKHARMQLTQFAWTHITLLLVVSQSTALLANVFEGLLWFLMPTSLIIGNDIFAYLFGRAFGRHKLIGVSPKKTWEGFIGAVFGTVVFTFFFSKFLASFDWMICPMTKFGTSFVPCERGWLYTPTTYAVPEVVLRAASTMGVSHWVPPTVELLPLQLHSMVYALFGSLIGPFGGFFASGVKRALKVDDFGDSIPGHGGLTDRFDCQLVMGTFANLYYAAFLKYGSESEYIMSTIRDLSTDAQVQLYASLGKLLSVKGVL